MERTSDSDKHQLVRCLDCGTVYDLPLAQDEAAPCPRCGAVGWVVVGAGSGREAESRS